jgi:hypothetical protein
MRKIAIASSLLVVSLGLGGCVSNPIADTISSVQVCAESARILGEMEEVLRMAVANPLATATYAKRLSELSDEFSALEPRNAELSDAHSALGAEIVGVVELLENPSLSLVSELPAVVAQSQIALMDFTQACTP